MSVQDFLKPGEKILSVCKPLYATSQRIVRYDERMPGGPVDEIAYHELTGVELMWKPSHPMMILGTISIISALFLSLTGLILITTVPALIIGVVLLGLGARGGPGYYRLRTRDSSPHPYMTPEHKQSITLLTVMEYLGLRTAVQETRWRMDYSKAGSFLATIRNIVGDLPEVDSR